MIYYFFVNKYVLQILYKFHFYFIQFYFFNLLFILYNPKIVDGKELEEEVKGREMRDERWEWKVRTDSSLNRLTWFFFSLGKMQSWTSNDSKKFRYGTSFAAIQGDSMIPKFTFQYPQFWTNNKATRVKVKWIRLPTGQHVVVKEIIACNSKSYDI